MYRGVEQVAEESARSTGRVLQAAAHKGTTAIRQPKSPMRNHQFNGVGWLKGRAKSNRRKNIGWKNDTENSRWSVFYAAFCEEKIKILFRVGVS